MVDDPRQVKRVAVIGTGTIGASWAAYFLARGLEVQASDPASDGEERLRRAIDRAWPALTQLGLAPQADPSRVRFYRDPREAVQGVHFIQENAPERLPIKLELLRQIDDAMPADAVFSSSTSGLLISDMQAGRKNAERYVTGHPFNPPHLIPLVEVVGGKLTHPAVVDWAMAFYTAIGKKAIRLHKEVPGHLVNRLQAALWREAVHAVASGIASVADVDTGIAYGPGLRWALMGPHMIFALAGGEGGMAGYLKHFGPPIQDWWADLGRPELTSAVCNQLIQGVADEAGGRSVEQIARERDALLIALLGTLAKARADLGGNS
ncbi:MAG: 3-hydroxyacyl-CoA dehydrogenase NAD-binding domain-containing protein [Gammaproteobacteria bacterium]